MYHMYPRLEEHYNIKIQHLPLFVTACHTNVTQKRCLFPATFFTWQQVPLTSVTSLTIQQIKYNILIVLLLQI